MKSLLRLLPVCLFSLLPFAAAYAASLDEIKKRGSVVIGVKTDYKPWGFTDANGNLNGMEIELARDIANRLSVKLVLVPALSSNRIALLHERKADIILATFSVTEERKKQVFFIEPSYYGAMTAILAKTRAALGNEAALKGRKICAVSGNYSNRAIALLVGDDLIESKTLPEAEERLRAGDCDGLSFDDAALLYELKSEGEKWQDYNISVLSSIPHAPWGLAIPSSEKNGALAKFLSKTVREWHRSGMLLALERKWVGDNSVALKQLTASVKSADTPAKSKREGASEPKAKPRRPLSPAASER